MLYIVMHSLCDFVAAVLGEILHSLNYFIIRACYACLLDLAVR